MTQHDTNIMMVNPEFDTLVHGLMDKLDEEKMGRLRTKFNKQLRVSVNNPETADLVESLWDFFYDWSIFEHHLPEKIKGLSDKDKGLWKKVKSENIRGLFIVKSVSEDLIAIKDLFDGKTYKVKRNERGSFIGISKSDFIEARLVGPEKEGRKEFYHFARRPAYHPTEVQEYMKQKIKDYKKAKDPEGYTNWLWFSVGMYLKHKIYKHMPVERIYDDNSRI